MTTPPTQLASLSWLNTPDDHWTQHQAAWLRDERRLYGGDQVLSELTQFDTEMPDSFDLRLRTGRYDNLPDRQMSLVAGHIIRAMPEINFGSMGDPRPRKEITTPQLSEIFMLNCDGVGEDGTQFKTWADGVIKRAGATGYRAVMVEMPQATTLADIRQRLNDIPEDEQDQTVLEDTSRLSEAERAAGWHPYLVEYSPYSWIRRGFTEGTLDYAVLRVKVPTVLAREQNRYQTEEDGLYVLVRKGYDRLGDMFKRGGWWLLGEDYRTIAEGDWRMTRGRIPLVLALAEHSLGTTLDPTIGRSLTMELGQIAVDLMNARSEQRYNARQAAKTMIFVMGGSTDTSQDIKTQIEAGSMVVTVVPTELPDGSKVVPNIWSSSSVAMDTAVYSSILAEGLEEARSIMVSQVVSDPSSSGESKKAGFEEAVSPLLSRCAGAFETWVNSILGFYAMRAGVKPDASLTMPSRFALRDVMSDVDQMFATMKESLMDAPTLSADLLVRKGDELALIPDEKREQILAELEESVERHGAMAPADYWTKMAAAIAAMVQIPGMTPQGAGHLLGLESEQVEVLRTGVPPGEAPGGPNATPTQEEKQRRADALAAQLPSNGGEPDQPTQGMPPGFRRQAERMAATAGPESET